MAQMVKKPPANIGDVGLIPGSGTSLGEGNGNPLQYSCRENSIPWTEKPGRQATIHWITESETIEQLTLSLFKPRYNT